MNILSQPLIKEEMLKFYPYNVGNSWSYWWVYHNAEIDFYEAGRDLYKIVSDTIISGKSYFTFYMYFKSYPDGYKYFERIDTSTGEIFRLISDDPFQQENLIDNIYANIGDTIRIQDRFFSLYDTCLITKSIYDFTISNIPTKIREVLYLPSGKISKFALGFGRLTAGEQYKIDSATINGNSYQIITGINESTQIPNDFVLNQNYPNPFNPSTTIEYVIPNVETRYSAGGGAPPMHVALKVYDILGREIATLVNEEQLPGKYSIKFNVETRHGASLPTGIYFYRIQIGRYSATRKMILLK